jgi:hypothetical protein
MATSQPSAATSLPKSPDLSGFFLAARSASACRVMFGCGLGGLVSMISPPGPRISGNGKHVHRDDPIVSWIDGGRGSERGPYRRFVQIRRQTHAAHRAGAEGDHFGSRGEGHRKNERQPHAQSSCCTTMQSNIKTKWSALPCACGHRLEGLSNARRSRWGTKGQAEWKLPARRSDK